MRLSRPAAVGKFTSPAERAQRFGLPILNPTHHSFYARRCRAAYTSRMPKVDLTQAPVRIGSGYPKQFQHVHGDTTARLQQRVSSGLTAIGASRVVLPPGAASSLRHYHTKQDELVIVLSGELVLLTDAGETPMLAGDIATFAKGATDAHTFVNRSANPAVIVAVSNQSDEDEWFYPDVGMCGDNRRGYVSIATGEPFAD
jgi:uncharacterized cupin superfamily protein